MPNVKLPSGADLYFETHGSGEALVLIPSTGFSADAWKPSQLPLAKSANLILHDPRGCGRSWRPNKSIRSSRWPTTSSRCSII